MFHQTILEYITSYASKKKTKKIGSQPKVRSSELRVQDHGGKGSTNGNSVRNMTLNPPFWSVLSVIKNAISRLREIHKSLNTFQKEIHQKKNNDNKNT